MIIKSYQEKRVCIECKRRQKNSEYDGFSWNGLGWVCAGCALRANREHRVELDRFYYSKAWTPESWMHRQCRDCKKKYSISMLHYDIIGGSMEENFCEKCWDKHYPPEEVQRVGKKSLRIRFLVLQRDGYRCRLCGKSAAQGAVIEACHRIAESKGGEYTMENLFAGCWECNHGMGTLEP